MNGPPRRPFGAWPPRDEKQPPPEGGIKIKKAGTTWWGQRWTDALAAMSPGVEARLARGKTYARAGRTSDLVVVPGKVTAKVTGSRPAPYDVTLTLTRLPDATWTRAIAAMAAQAKFSAALLAGEMPREIDEAFGAAGASLFPVDEQDLVTACTCPDWSNPCKHVAATHYVLGEAFDRDPFLLFELRGRARAEVLAALRVARGGGAERAEPIRTVAWTPVSVDAYDAPRAPLALHVAFDAPRTPGAFLKQLGAPRSWGDDTPPGDVLAPRVRAAAERARRLALGGADDEAERDRGRSG